MTGVYHQEGLIFSRIIQLLSLLTGLTVRDRSKELLFKPIVSHGGA